MKRALLAVKLTVTLGFVAWLVWFIDWQTFWYTLANSTLWVIALVLALRLATLVLSAFKWQQILMIHRLRYGLAKLVRWYLVASFLNYFLPTSIGGDGFRIYKTLDNVRSRSYAVLAVLIERVTGLAALVVLGVGAALVVYARSGDPLAGAFALVAGAGLLGSPLVIWALVRAGLVPRIARTRLGAKPVAALRAVAADFRENTAGALVVVLLSFVFHATKICVVWLLIYALGSGFGLLELAVTLAVVEIIGLLPISLGGLGLVDGSFVYVAGHFGAAHEVALAAMLLMRVLLIPFTLVGAGFYFLGDRDLALAAQIESEGYVHGVAK